MKCHGDLGWQVSILHQAGLFNEGDVGFDGRVVTVSEEDRYDIVGMRGYPGLYLAEIVGDGARV